MKIQQNPIQKKNYLTIKKENTFNSLEPSDKVILGNTYCRETKPLIIAHRGASGLAPENTMAAFKKAYDTGVSMIELDVQKTKDGHLVIMHDDTVDRTTNGKGKIEDLTLEEIKKLDAGSWFSSEYTGEKIPTLGEVLEWAKDKIKVDIEVKDYKQYRSMESELNSIIEENNAGKNVMVTSFSKDVLKRIKENNPELKTGLLVKPTHLKTALISGLVGGMALGIAGGIMAGVGPLVSAGLAVAGGGAGILVGREICKKIDLKGAEQEKADVLLPFWALTDKSWVEKAHSTGKMVYPYTVNNPLFVKKLVNLDGVDGIITDKPENFVEK